MATYTSRYESTSHIPLTSYRSQYYPIRDRIMPAYSRTGVGTTSSYSSSMGGTTYGSSYIYKTRPNRNTHTDTKPVKAVHNYSTSTGGTSTHQRTLPYSSGLNSSFSDMSISSSSRRSDILPNISSGSNSSLSTRNIDNDRSRRGASSPSVHRRSASMDRVGVTRDRAKTQERTGLVEDRIATFSRRTSLDRTHISVNGTDKTEGLVGLANLGNTCFMNSILQCLSKTQPLLQYCLKDRFYSEMNNTTSTMRGALIKAYSDLMKSMWKSSYGGISPSEFKVQIQKFAPRFSGYRQHDSQEFLLCLLEGLHEDINRVTKKQKPFIDCETGVETISAADKSKKMWDKYVERENSMIVDTFVGQLKSALTCTTCNYVSNTFDPVWNLALPLKNKTYGDMTLTECFDLFTQEEVLDFDEKPTCAKCEERRKCTKRFSIQRFPKIFVIYLKRFDHGSIRSKLKTKVDFPLEGLDLSKYASLETSTKGMALYNLYAVSNHSGTTYSGHYTAYCKHPQTGEWHYYNDSHVTKVSPQRVISSEAYVLFYELASSASPKL